MCFAEETSAAGAQTDLNINEACSVQSCCGSFFIVLYLIFAAFSALTLRKSNVSGF